jgi:hypothetical protein
LGYISQKKLLRDITAPFGLRAKKGKDQLSISVSRLKMLSDNSFIFSYHLGEISSHLELLFPRMDRRIQVIVRSPPEE